MKEIQNINLILIILFKWNFHGELNTILGHTEQCTTLVSCDLTEWKNSALLLFF